MTLCELIKKPITRMVEEEGKNLDEIAEEVCPSVEFGREKIIRVIKDFFGEEYLIQHAETLKYDVGKADLAKKRKTRSHKKIDAGADSVVESKSVPPIASCQTTVQAVIKEQVKETGQMKGREQVLEENKTPAVCCQERKKIASEEEAQDELQDIAVDVSDELVEALKKLIRLFSLEEVKTALGLAESEV